MEINAFNVIGVAIMLMNVFAILKVFSSSKTELNPFGMTLWSMIALLMLHLGGAL